jgi:anti-sigma regulatory factor (Ser/Thr protein kinase)
MITVATRTREMPLGAPKPTDGLAVAVVRTEGASVSHDRLLTASGYPGRSFTPHLPTGLEVVAVGEEIPPAATCPLPAVPESARRARDFTRTTLEDWDMAALEDVAELVVSELVTNSLRHGVLSSRWLPDQHPIGLTLLRRDPYLMCLVTDPDPGGPVLMQPGASAESGRGLQVVESCSEAWGWQSVEGAGKVVWVLLR